MKKLIVSFFLCLVLITSVTSSFATNVSGVVNINTATQEELALLPGIGDIKAQAIVDLRTTKAFAKIEDLLLVKGIGEKVLAKISPYLVLEGKTTIQEKEE